MEYSQADLDMAERHLVQGERHVRLQIEIIAHLQAVNGSTILAEQLLEEFEATLHQHREHRDRIKVQLSASDG